MRPLIGLIVLGTVGFGGWQLWQKHPEYLTRYLPKAQPAAAASAPVKSPAVATPIPSLWEPTVVADSSATAEPLPIAPVAEILAEAKPSDPTPVVTRTKLPPGQFLMTERVSVETRDGIVAVVPGELVKLLERRRDGTLKVTNGKTNFVVRQSQVTQEEIEEQKIAGKP